ncbi:hypothetical protein CASFOL_013681 [Castilleja foliolosa]|uniref:F-box domain-containing protein n=1 Tax=Castilleja foliolosa TaxID=1961234 RepID=A0ABD3DPQ7_9LAMI
MRFPNNFPTNLLRQPPSPHRRSTANEKTEEERSTGQQGKSLIMNMESSSLPDDAWFEILAHLSAKDIYDLARFVCWKWYRMIYTHTFIYTNLQYTPYGLLFIDRDYLPFFVTIQQGRVETSKLSDAFTPGLWNTCNGLIVTRARRNRTDYYIANPLTKQVFVLPPTSARTNGRWLCGIGYTSVSMKYKVVVNNASNGQWAILTPGVDSCWRVVNTDCLELLLRTVMRPPLITEGFMHWTFDGSRIIRKIGNQVLTLDLESEIVTKSCVPLSYDAEYDHWKYLSTGRYLTVLITYGKCLWEVWEMESGEWRKLDGVIIDLGTRMFDEFGFQLVPVGWLKYLEVLVLRGNYFSPPRVYNFIYNLLTKKTNVLVLPMECICIDPVVHKNSLVWLAGC